jgi:hypothetical protein
MCYDGLMKALVTLRLEPETRRTLAEEARRLGIPFRTLLRTIAEEHAHESRRRQIRAQSKAVAARLKRSRTRRHFFEDWGTPTARIDPE